MKCFPSYAMMKVQNGNHNSAASDMEKKVCRLVELKTNYGISIRVADIKYSCIKNIINAAPDCRQISEIILFGSSLEEKCSAKSDIDIVIVSPKGLHDLSSTKGFNNFMDKLYEFDMTQEYDRLYFRSIEEIEAKQDKVPICKELTLKGKIIYRRDSH